MTDQDELFRDKIGSKNGPTLDELMRLVPEKFLHEGNAWWRLADEVRDGSRIIDGADFMSGDAETVAHQRNCLAALLVHLRNNRTPTTLVRVRAITAFMLSRMLRDDIVRAAGR